MFRRLLLGVFATILVAGSTAPNPLVAQERPTARDLLESQRRLDEVREERRQLQEEMDRLRTVAQGATSELRNVERQLSASRTVLAEVDFQIENHTTSVDETSEALVQAQVDLERNQSTLAARLKSIYMRGPLHSLRVLLGADSFSNLLTRYRYLAAIAEYDRDLVDRVASLESELLLRNRELQEGLSELHRLRDEKVTELGALQRVEGQRQATLDRYRNEVASTESRLATLAADEEQLASLIGDLEVDRTTEDRRAVISGAARSGTAAGGGGSNTGSEAAEAATPSRPAAGELPWPVEGDLLYRFGRERRPNGTVLRWNGIGIRATAGTPVKSVLPGTVALAGPFQGYGPTVVLSHGDGLYTLYLYLETISVLQGRSVEAGEVLGTVGGTDTPEGAHVEFQIRAPVSGSSPQAMDPLQWLRSRGGM